MTPVIGGYRDLIVAYEGCRTSIIALERLASIPTEAQALKTTIVEIFNKLVERGRDDKRLIEENSRYHHQH